MRVLSKPQMVQGHWAMGTGSRDCSLNQVLFAGATICLNLDQIFPLARLQFLHVLCESLQGSYRL